MHNQPLLHLRRTLLPDALCRIWPETFQEAIVSVVFVEERADRLTVEEAVNVQKDSARRVEVVRFR